MAGNDGTSTELFPGWSSVVHQPCEEPEESELPSTVDMAAFSTGLNVEPTNASQRNDNSDSDSDSEIDSSNSGSEASQSGSQSDSSDSDSSTSSQESSSRSPSPEFSVTSSQTNGLRLTIATVRKSTGSPINEKVMNKASDRKSNKSSTSDSPCSTDSGSDSEGSNKSDVPVNKVSAKSAKDVKKPVTKTRTKDNERKDDKKTTKKEVNAANKTTNNKSKSRQKKKKMASLPLSRGSTYTSSDSDESDADSAMLASCSLQEIRQEDLAAILPDQQECDAFADFECNRNDKTSPQAGDMSGSDMELPQQAVNALIQRTTESSSESESHAPPNPSTLYANSLLQQFVAQTQMLNTPCPVISNSNDNAKSQTTNAPNNESQTKLESDSSKRRRGRPKKTPKGQKAKNEEKSTTANQEYCANPNVSPDSGIQNSPDHISSPEPSLSPNVKQKTGKEDSKKSTNIDKVINKNNKCDKVVKSAVNVTVNKQPVSSVNNKSKDANKLSVTANRFDRLLYANADRVLYPPRRKVGRPPVNRKGPGRPPKHKTAPTTENIDSKQAPTSEKTTDKIKSKTKHKNRPVLAVKNKLDNKAKFTTLKNAKLMHSKHKHKKHKKCKFKILKPITATDPKIVLEIDKLIADFMRLCVIGSLKQPKENVPELLKTLKKVSKKRKTTDHAEKKKKKQSISTTVNKVNSNEQRLPLKKRHYHLSVSNDSKNENETVTSPNNVNEIKHHDNKTKSTCKQNLPTNKAEKPKTANLPQKAEIVKTNPTAKYVPVIKSNTSSPKVQSINNNEYEVKEQSKDLNLKAVGSHIDEAIEACINRFADDKLNSKALKTEESPVKEEKMNTSNSSITATTPKKRHRLEMANSTEKVVEQVKVETESSPEDKAKAKISVETFITELKIKRNLIPKTNSSPIPPGEESKKVITTVEPMEVVVEKPKHVELKKTQEDIVKASTEANKKKVRKRRAINRTGFPTMKKKKKKIVPATDISTTETVETKTENTCDRVPKEGEEYTKYVQRMEKMETLDTSTTESLNKTDDILSKWEVMSECDSLPQDERTEFEFDDMKPERMTLRHRDSSPATSVDTRMSDVSKNKIDDDMDEISLESSIERLRSRLDKKKRKRASEKFVDNLNGYPKRRLRDVSPASSIEPVTERRLRDERASASGDEMKRGKKAPRWRKKYLVAGLFSDYYKEDDETTRQKRTESAAKSRFVYNPEEHPYGLLPPPYHCGKYLRCRKLPFQLPYDLWWQHTHNQLPGRDIVPSWNYRKIRTNVYNVKISTGACEPQSCNCKPSSNCGDDCINRLVLSECPASHRCQNQKIQKHEWAPGLEKFMTEAKGWGVRTKQPIKNGEFILEYVGEVVSDQEFKERMGTIYVNDTHHYCLHLDGGLVIDGHRMGGDGRFVNHSCQPNCEIQKWSVNGQFRMALFALRDILAGEELTYDYNFSLFNPAEGQECKCGSNMCRGVIGGKSQRVRQLPPENTVKQNPGRVGRPRKTEAKKKANNAKDTPVPQPQAQVVPPPHVKPMSHQQKCFILEHHCFLLRNLSKVRKVRDRSLSTASVPRQHNATPTDHSSTFLNHLNALQKPRNMRTRRLAQAEDDPELNKTVKLAAVLRDLYNVVTSAKDEKEELLSSSFMTMPSKRKVPEFYTRITDPIDLSTIEQNIAKGIYKTADIFDADMTKLFNSYIRFYGRATDMGISAAKLKKIYMDAKRLSWPKIHDALGTKPPSAVVSKRKKNEEEDIIRCICGMHHDEGIMIQCERCLVWQHCECVKADVNAPSYHCETCVPRKVDYEIPLEEYTEHGHQYYMTLMRGDLQLRQGDTVYVLRDIPIPNTDRKHTYDTIGKIEFSELDIFRIERLWKDCKTGKRFAYGHHYLRPHETYHEPTRKFFPNEVMRVPLYEAVPVELVITHCWVVDLNTYCKGRPFEAPEEHIYICEYRVDKSARLFSKVAKSKFPICTKSYAFERFETRLKISRTYTPHALDATVSKPRGRKPQENEEPSREVVPSIPVGVPVVRTPAEQKTRLNKILLNLLSKMPSKQVIDVSYLLEGGRRRKKQNESVKN